jgi:hypothetical protein
MLFYTDNPNVEVHSMSGLEYDLTDEQRRALERIASRDEWATQKWAQALLVLDQSSPSTSISPSLSAALASATS